jgi:hypothetical protein
MEVVMPRSIVASGSIARTERGQVLPMVLVAVLVTGVVALGLVHVAAASARRGAAQAAADSAALAGAAGGEQEARSAAAANGARLVSYETSGTDVVVVVERSGIRAHARARWEQRYGSPGAIP